MARKSKEEIRVENRLLVERFPFLYPTNAFTGEYENNYNYSYTILDEMPVGWKKRFAEEMCEEIYAQLLKENALPSYRVGEVKEKYGELRWYDNGSGKVRAIVDKYSYISEHVCTQCGKMPVPLTNDGWVLPVCFSCWKKNKLKQIRWVRENTSETVDEPDAQALKRQYDSVVIERKLVPVRRYAEYMPNGKNIHEEDYTELIEKLKKKKVES